MKAKSISILRGQELSQAAPDSLAITSVLAEDSVPASHPFALALVVSEDSTVKIACGSGLSHTPCVPFSQGYQIELPEYQLAVHFGILPWWQFPDFELPAGQRVLYVPLRAWYRQQWHDGPIAHYVPQGYLSSFVPAGAPAKLCLPMDYVAPSEEVIPYIRSSFTNEQMKWLAKRTSAAMGIWECLHSQLDQGHHQIAVQKYDRIAVVLMCLLRIAFPDYSFELAALPAKKEDEVAWKRLCQNLEIICGKAPRPSPVSQLIQLDLYRHHVPESVCLPLMEALNEHSPMIPNRLFPAE